MIRQGHPRRVPCCPHALQPSTQVAAEGAKAQPQARSAPSVELPLVTANREELSAMPVKDLKKILAERGIGCARYFVPLPGTRWSLHRNPYVSFESDGSY